MKILVVSSLSILDAVGGAERSTHLTAVALARLGHDVSLVAFSRTSSPGIYYVDGIKIYLFRLVNFYWPFTQEIRPSWLRILFNALDVFNPYSIYCAIMVANRERSDLIWSNMIKGWSAGLWIAFRLLRLPVVATLREFDSLYSGSSLMRNPDRPQKVWGLWQIKSIISLAPNLVIGISHDILNRYIASGYFKFADRCVIGNPIVVDARSARFCRNRDERKLRIGWLGRFSGEKGLTVFLDVAKFLKEAGSAFSFEVAGNGDSELLHLVLEAERSGYVHYHGYKKSSDFLQCVDVLVVTSLWPEPFGRVVIEAFQNYCYVISSNRGGLPEVNSNPLIGSIYDGTVYGLLDALEHLDADIVKIDPSVFDFEIEKYLDTIIGRKYEEVFISLLEIQCSEAVI